MEYNNLPNMKFNESIQNFLKISRNVSLFFLETHKQTVLSLTSSPQASDLTFSD